MKPKKFNKRLTLRKQTIANFNQEAMSAVRGGTDLSCVIQCAPTANPYHTCIPVCPANTTTCYTQYDTCNSCTCPEQFTCETCDGFTCPCL